MSEVFTLRQHLDSTRQELAQALYQHDAACRVIARLMVERDEARAMLTNLSESGMMSTPVVLQEQLNENMTDAEPLEKSVRSEDVSICICRCCFYYTSDPVVLGAVGEDCGYFSRNVQGFIWRQERKNFPISCICLNNSDILCYQEFQSS
jgi:hypothetical protein